MSDVVLREARANLISREIQAMVFADLIRAHLGGHEYVASLRERTADMERYGDNKNLMADLVDEAINQIAAKI